MKSIRIALNSMYNVMRKRENYMLLFFFLLDCEKWDRILLLNIVFRHTQGLMSIKKKKKIVVQVDMAIYLSVFLTQ